MQIVKSRMYKSSSTFINCYCLCTGLCGHKVIGVYSFATGTACLGSFYLKIDSQEVACYRQPGTYLE